MPKLKTNKGVAKRMRVTKNGKVMRRRQGMRHLLSHKSSKKRRNLQKATCVKPNKAKAIKAVLHQ